MDDNLRRGNNTENLGLHLLRGLGAVAPVPRDQDVGIDAIVTLLGRDEGRRLKAGSTIFVQLKSATVAELELTREDVEWIDRLELPFFIGSVDSEQSRITLYTTHPLLKRGSAARLCLNPSKVPPEDRPELLPGESPIEWLDRIRSKSLACLGPPVLEWRLEDVHDPTFLTSATKLLEEWAKVSRRIRLYASVGEVKDCEWNEGMPPADGGWGFGRGSRATLPDAVELFNIGLKRIAQELGLAGKKESLLSLIEAVKPLQELGVDAGVAIAALANAPRCSGLNPRPDPP